MTKDGKRPRPAYRIVTAEERQERLWHDFEAAIRSCSFTITAATLLLLMHSPPKPTVYIGLAIGAVWILVCIFLIPKKAWIFAGIHVLAGILTSVYVMIMLLTGAEMLLCIILYFSYMAIREYNHSKKQVIHVSG